MDPITRQSLAEIRDHGRAMDNHASALREAMKTAKELPGMVGQETRDTADHVGMGGGLLMILWFILKLLLLWFAGKKA